MKNYLLLLLIIFGYNLNAQTEIEKGSYQFTSNIIEDFSPLKEKGDTQEVEIFQGSKVTVVGMSDDLKTVYIKYWNYSTNIKTRNGFLGKVTLSANQKATDFNNKVF